jgi:hypothetical protein
MYHQQRRDSVVFDYMYMQLEGLYKLVEDQEIKDTSPAALKTAPGFKLIRRKLFYTRPSDRWKKRSDGRCPD